MSQAVAS